MDFGMLGAAVVMGIAAIGSAIGIGIAGQGAIGAWKRCYINNKPGNAVILITSLLHSFLQYLPVLLLHRQFTAFCSCSL